MAERTISRRDFLKLLGFGAVALSVGPLLNFGNIFDTRKIAPQLASGQVSGSWVLGQNTTAVAIHAAIMPNGKIFYLAGSGYHRDRPNGPFDARILDLSTGSEKNLPLTEDLFCIGITHLANGNVLLAGGTLMYDTDPDNCNGGEWKGLNSTYEVDWNSDSLVWVASMAHGRWYPTLVTLSDGNVMIINGLDEYGTPNRLVEIYNPSSKTWSKKFDPNTNLTYCVGINQVGKCPGAGSPCYGGSQNGVAPPVGTYPRMHLMPSGLVITCGGQVSVRSWEPATGKWALLTQNTIYRHYGASFLLPLHNISSERGKILLVGGSPTAVDYATTSAEILDFDLGTSTSPVVRQVAPITYRRKMQAPVILPNGQCVVFGGSERNNTIPVRIPELFDPQTESWQALPTASVDRVYHQVSLLLPDGRVWTAGSTVQSNFEENRTEIYSPSYLFQGPRPVISGLPTVGDYGDTISIPTLDALTASSVSLVRLMSSTHHYEANQRLIWLQILNRGPNVLTVSAPINNKVAPPGPYLIHILNALGVPSVAKIIQIPGTGTGGGDVTAPSKVLGLTVTPISSSRLDLAWTTNPEPDVAHYNVYRGTTVGFAVNTATDTPLAQPIANSYSDTTGLTESTTYYYKVAAVDTSANIGILSDEASGTTVSTGEIFYNVAIPGNKAVALNTGGSIRYGEEAFSASSVLIGKSMKSWKVRLRKAGTPSGMVTAKIRRKSDDSVIATFNQTINSTALGTAFAEYTFTLTNPYTIQPGDRIMIEYGGPASVQLEQWNIDKIDGSNTRRIRYDGAIYVGGNAEDVAGTMSSTSSGGADTTPPSKVLGLTVTPVSSSQLNLAWAVNTEPDLARYNVYRGTIPGFPVNPSTDTPLAQPTTNSYSNAGLTGSTTYYYKVAAVDTSGNIGVLSDEGSGTTTAAGVFYDVAIPGNVGAAVNAGGSVRYGEEAFSASSVIIGRPLKSWKVRLRKSGTPSGLVTAKIRRKSDDSVVATFNESIDSTSLGTAFAERTFTLTNTYTIQSGDRIMIEYTGPAAINIEIWNVDKIDGSNTRRVRYDGSSYIGGNTEDVTGTMATP
jgi:fibronectin type 3 domain-containing protein